MFVLFIPESPTIWLFIVAVIFLLFGGSRLPQLAKALGQSKRAFKEGLEESKEKDLEQQKTRAEEVAAKNKVSLESIDDETLFAEPQRRARLRDSAKEP